jgi:hypothetical protein
MLEQQHRDIFELNQIHHELVWIVGSSDLSHAAFGRRRHCVGQTVNLAIAIGCVDAKTSHSSI